MIINLRGTSGSGKSYLARQLMARYDSVHPNYIEGRRQPFTYDCMRGGRILRVIGHYETPCGGADTISRHPVTGAGAMDTVYGLAREAAADGKDVLFEGLIVESDVNRCVAMHEDGLPLVIIILDVPIEECLKNVQERRDARGDTRPFNPANTVNRVSGIAGREQRLRSAGVDLRRISRPEALVRCSQILGIADVKQPPLKGYAAPTKQRGLFG